MTTLKHQAVKDALNKAVIARSEVTW